MKLKELAKAILKLTSGYDVWNSGTFSTLSDEKLVTDKELIDSFNEAKKLIEEHKAIQEAHAKWIIDSMEKVEKGMGLTIDEVVKALEVMTADKDKIEYHLAPTSFYTPDWNDVLRIVKFYVSLPDWEKSRRIMRHYK